VGERTWVLCRAGICAEDFEAHIGELRAADIDPLARGVGWLLSETGTPRRIKAAYLDDDTIKYLAAYAARLRHGAAA
jgi:hypothetical protein